jgi:hypothetical protein
MALGPGRAPRPVSADLSNFEQCPHGWGGKYGRGGNEESETYRL